MCVMMGKYRNPILDSSVCAGNPFKAVRRPRPVKARSWMGCKPRCVPRKGDHHRVPRNR